MMNGFTWVGDIGAGPGFGLAKGFVQNDSQAIGNNVIGGGTVGQWDGNKLAFSVSPGDPAMWKEGSTTPLWTSPTIPPLVISGSSTSIVKYGTCSGDTTVDKWSSFGTSPGGRLIFMSSLSNTTTSAAQLCPLFQALGADNAIRLDDSTAAGLTIDGIRKNPITGSATFFWGSSRHIAYALRVGHADAGAAATPVLGEGRVSGPKSPCQVNPQACQ